MGLDVTTYALLKKKIIELEKSLSDKQLKFKLVEQLPEVGELNIIYLIKLQSEEADNYYEEYVYLEDGKWEKLGTTQMDLTNVATKEDLEELAAQQFSGSWNDLTDRPFYIGESETVIDREILREFELHGPTYEQYYDYDDEGNIIDEWVEMVEEPNFEELRCIEDFVGKTVIVTIDDQEYICETTKDIVTWEEEVGDGEYETYEEYVYTLISNDENFKIVIDPRSYPWEHIFINGVALDRYDENLKHYLKFEEEYEKTVTPVKTLDLAVMPDGYPKYSSSGKAYLTSEKVSIDQGTLETFRARWYDEYEDEYYYGEEHFAYVIPLSQIFNNLIDDGYREVLTIRAYENNGEYTDFIYLIRSNYSYYGYAYAGNTKLIWPKDYIFDEDHWYTELDDNWYVEENSWTDQISYYGGDVKDSIIVPQKMAKKYVSFEVLFTPDKIDTLNPDFLPSNIRNLPDEVDYLQNELSSQSYLTDRQGNNPIEYKDLPDGYGTCAKCWKSLYIKGNLEYMGYNLNIYDPMDESYKFYRINNPIFNLQPNTTYTFYCDGERLELTTNELGYIFYEPDPDGDYYNTYFTIRKGSLWTYDYESDNKIILDEDCWYLCLDGDRWRDFDPENFTIEDEIVYDNYQPFNSNFIKFPDGYAYTEEINKTSILYQQAPMSSPEYIDEYGGCYKYNLSDLNVSSLPMGADIDVWIDWVGYEPTGDPVGNFEVVREIIGYEPYENMEWDEELEEWIPVGGWYWPDNWFIKLEENNSFLYTKDMEVASVNITGPVKEEVLVPFDPKYIPREAGGRLAVPWENIENKPFGAKSVVLDDIAEEFDEVNFDEGYDADYGNYFKFHNVNVGVYKIDWENEIAHEGEFSYENHSAILERTQDSLGSYHNEMYKVSSPEESYVGIYCQEIEESELFRFFPYHYVEGIGTFYSRNFRIWNCNYHEEFSQLDEQFIPDSIARTSQIPSKTSDLENDSGFLTSPLNYSDMPEGYAKASGEDIVLFDDETSVTHVQPTSIGVHSYTPITLLENKKYLVVFENKEYICELTENSGMLYLGSIPASEDGYTGEEDYPFFIAGDVGGMSQWMWSIPEPSYETTFDFKVVELNREVTPFNDEFIPDTIARTSQVPFKTSDLENDSNYISKAELQNILNQIKLNVAEDGTISISIPTIP